MDDRRHCYFSFGAAHYVDVVQRNVFALFNRRLTAKMKVAGISEARPAASDAAEVASKIRACSGGQPRWTRSSTLRHFQVATQVVAGINYLLKFLVDPDRSQEVCSCPSVS